MELLQGQAATTGLDSVMHAQSDDKHVVGGLGAAIGGQGGERGRRTAESDSKGKRNLPVWKTV